MLRLSAARVRAGLSRAHDKPLYAQKRSALFEHIFDSYPEREAGIYASAL